VVELLLEFVDPLAERGATEQVVEHVRRDGRQQLNL
jgi:hypothetical protein